MGNQDALSVTLLCYDLPHFWGNRTRPAPAIPPRCTSWNWRRERDSNPRYPCGYSGFQDRLFQPLTHPSAPASLLLILRRRRHCDSFVTVTDCFLTPRPTPSWNDAICRYRRVATVPFPPSRFFFDANGPQSLAFGLIQKICQEGAPKSKVMSPHSTRLPPLYPQRYLAGF